MDWLYAAKLSHNDTIQLYVSGYQRKFLFVTNANIVLDNPECTKNCVYINSLKSCQ